jgi:hypothetical protein
MAYIKPAWFPKHVFNRLAMRTGISGAHTLTVKRRSGGEVQKIPVIPIEQDGAVHVVSTRGESDWVKNVRAAGQVELHGKEADGTFRASEVPLDQREPLISAYRAKAGRTVEAYWKKLPEPADHPVFRLERSP